MSTVRVLLLKIVIITILMTPLVVVLSPRVERPCMSWQASKNNVRCTEYGPTGISIGISATDYMRRIFITWPWNY